VAAWHAGGDMKKKVYLDTTIPSYFYDERRNVAFFSKTTQDWFADEAGRYDIYVSEATLVEVSQGNYKNKDLIVRFTKRWPVLSNAGILHEIAEAYVENYLMPDEFGGDAVHLAYASYYRMDFLLTWNCQHLANANKKEHIRVINSRLGLSVPEITTPLELIAAE
jgi:hypothetical protein